MRLGLRWLLVLILLLPTLFFLDHTRQIAPPHQAEWLDAAGMRWRALRGGRGDTTVVLLHGYGEHLLTWRGIFDPVARRYRVLAVDLPGFGISDKPKGPYTLAAQTERVRALLDRWTEGPLVLVGHSMGGAIATATALDLPQRVVGVVLIAPAGLAPGLGRIQDHMGERGRAAVGWWESLRAFITPVHDPTWLSEPPGMADYDPLQDPEYRASAARVLAEFDFAALGDRFGELRQPVLVLWGRNDPVIPFETGEHLARLLPCNRFAPLPALHRPQAERPDTVASLVLAFLARPGCKS